MTGRGDGPEIRPRPERPVFATVRIMTQAFAVTTTISRPADEVWAALVDWSQAARWMPGVDSMTADGPNEVGTELVFRARGKDRPSSIAALDSGRAITLRSAQGGVTADYRYRVEPVGESATAVHLDAECSTTGAWSVIGPLLRMAMKRTDSGQLEALKTMLESETG